MEDVSLSYIYWMFTRIRLQTNWHHVKEIIGAAAFLFKLEAKQSTVKLAKST